MTKKLQRPYRTVSSNITCLILVLKFHGPRRGSPWTESWFGPWTRRKPAYSNNEIFDFCQINDMHFSKLRTDMIFSISFTVCEGGIDVRHGSNFGTKFDCRGSCAEVRLPGLWTMTRHIHIWSGLKVYDPKAQCIHLSESIRSFDWKYTAF